jgi:pimeloyl-ACP methyl ester carboxylesterase
VKHIKLKSEGARLSVRDYGGNGEPLVLIHGLGASQKSWRRLITELGDRYRIITYDQRGHGGSGHSSDYSWLSFVGDLEELIVQLGLTNFALAGHSLGAGVALEVARQTNQCRAVTMIDGAFPVEVPPPDTNQLDRLQHNPLFILLRGARRVVNRGMSMSFADVLALAEEYRHQFPRWEQELRSLTCPAQYLLGTKQGGPNGPIIQEARQATAELIVSLNPMVKVQWIDGGHGMARTNPVDVARAITGFEPKT